MQNLLAPARDAGAFASAELLAAVRGKTVLHQKLFASRGEKFFDFASLTKPLATALLAMLVFQEGRLSPDDVVSDFFSTKSLQDVTVRALLTHVSPLKDWHNFAAELWHPGRVPFVKNRKIILDRILNDKVLTRPDNKTLYSDLGYILLGALIEKIYDKDLATLFRLKIARPLGLQNEVFYVPLAKPTRIAKEKFVPTETCALRGRLICGEVMDENASFMGGVSGHAGLFGTASGVARILTELRQARLGRSKIFSRSTLEIFCTPDVKRNPTQRCFTLGFDTPTKPHSQSGNFFSQTTIGHLGYSGTSFWWDLERDVWIVLFTNHRLHGRENKKLLEWRPKIHDAVMQGLGVGYKLKIPQH